MCRVGQTKWSLARDMITTGLNTVQGTGKDPSPGKEWMLRTVRVELRILRESANRPGYVIISTAE